LVASGQYELLADQTATGDTITVPESGVFTIQGLKAGTYYYKELTPPTNYVANNAIVPFTVVTGIVGTTLVDLDSDKLSDINGLEEDKADNILNYHKGTLPSTGGKGIVIFFIVAAVAGIGFVIVKKSTKTDNQNLDLM
jgi:LPXTG-motif cell wall-anchored protein